MTAALGELAAIRGDLRQSLPGLALVSSVALLARVLHGLIPIPVLGKAISEVLIAVLLGLLVRNLLGYSARFEPGIKFALRRLLRLGIILLGLRLSLQDVVSTGVSALLLVLSCIAVGLAAAYLCGRLFRLPPRLVALIGVGTAICGNSAIIATAPVIEARDEEVSLAVAVITCFGTLAVIFYPIVGHLLGFSDRAFGMWAGTAVNDTSMVVAAGAAFSNAARDVATVVKLTRNTLMAPIIVLIGVLYARAGQGRSARSSGRVQASIGSVVPWFVAGFVFMACLRTAGVALGVLPQDVTRPGDLGAAATWLQYADEVAKLAILMALSGIGLGTGVAQLRKIGVKPFLAGLLGAALLAGFSLGVILTAHLG